MNTFVIRFKGPQLIDKLQTKVDLMGGGENSKAM